MYLLDTDTLKVVDIGDAYIAAIVEQIPRSQIFISIVTVAEVMQGWLAEINRNHSNVKGGLCKAYENLAEAQAFLEDFNIVRYSEQIHAVYQGFPNAAKRVGTNDCRIAATAIAHGLTVITRNTRDFAKIPNVKFEDWTAN